MHNEQANESQEKGANYNNALQIATMSLFCPVPGKTIYKNDVEKGVNSHFVTQLLLTCFVYLGLCIWAQQKATPHLVYRTELLLSAA